MPPQEGSSILGYQAHTKAGRWAIDRLAKTKKVQRLNNQFGSDTIVNKAMTRLGSHKAPAPLGQTIIYEPEAVKYNHITPYEDQSEKLKKSDTDQMQPITPYQVQYKQAETRTKQTLKADDGADEPPSYETELKRIETRLKRTASERNNAIDTGNGKSEKDADAMIVSHLKETGALSSPKGKAEADQLALKYSKEDRAGKDKILVLLLKKVVTHGLMKVIIGGGLALLATGIITGSGSDIIVKGPDGEILDNGTMLTNPDGTETMYWDSPDDEDLTFDHSAVLTQDSYNPDHYTYDQVQDVSSSDLLSEAGTQVGVQADSLVDHVSNAIESIFGWL